ncbi:MAG: TetR/AcrR family transcriptional regulator [Kineosporiaceae bacterium]|nr:TetR/AcrR family transcriptional regulator [Aeromicrobium sp.]
MHALEPAATPARPESLRARQQRVARATILDATLEMLVESDDEPSYAEIARRSGVARRTLYRYFPTRDELYAAVGEHTVTRLGLPIDIGTSSQLVASFKHASGISMRNVPLARALVKTTAGRRVRSGPWSRRSAAVATALEDAVAHLPPRQARGATAIMQYLFGLHTWVRLHDEYGLSPEDARESVAWALETLLSELRHGKGPADRGN